MYQLFYDLFLQYIFLGADIDAYQQLVCTEMATICSIAILVLPLFVVWRILFR